VADGKYVFKINDRRYLVERPTRAEYALIAAHRSDYIGKLDYALTAQNFIPADAGVFLSGRKRGHRHGRARRKEWRTQT
jgi:acyl CoA:acetate/3-ketoacid CoA transferase alpha subunit